MPLPERIGITDVDAVLKETTRPSERKVGKEVLDVGVLDTLLL